MAVLNSSSRCRQSDVGSKRGAPFGRGRNCKACRERICEPEVLHGRQEREVLGQDLCGSCACDLVPDLIAVFDSGPRFLFVHPLHDDRARLYFNKFGDVSSRNTGLCPCDKRTCSLRELYMSKARAGALCTSVHCHRSSCGESGTLGWYLGMPKPRAEPDEWMLGGAGLKCRPWVWRPCEENSVIGLLVAIALAVMLAVATLTRAPI
mmetsp:Transcript_38007/g.120799  ORF Transcript_38007/g.120799 Transcript_38007/m.120799 type:complete len:207 (-) Transcript_38007:265-885(-)